MGIDLIPMLLSLAAAQVPRHLQARALVESGGSPAQVLSFMRKEEDSTITLARLGFQALLGYQGHEPPVLALARELGIHPLSFALQARGTPPTFDVLRALGLQNRYPVRLERPDPIHVSLVATEPLSLHRLVLPPHACAAGASGAALTVSDPVLASGSILGACSLACATPTRGPLIVRGILRGGPLVVRGNLILEEGANLSALEALEVHGDLSLHRIGRNGLASLLPDARKIHGLHLGILNLGGDCF